MAAIDSLLPAGDVEDVQAARAAQVRASAASLCRTAATVTRSLLRTTMPRNLSLVIGSFWLGRPGAPGDGDGGDDDP